MEKIVEFDPIHRILRDTEGQILKKVRCPKLKSWSTLAENSNAQAPKRHCDSCDKSVIDTAYLSYDEIVEAVKHDPQVCFRIRSNQDNIIVKVRYIKRQLPWPV